MNATIIKDQIHQKLFLSNSKNYKKLSQKHSHLISEPNTLKAKKIHQKRRTLLAKIKMNFNQQFLNVY
jgi:hypothetical protein